jgi:branched-chain amino acid transport system ATP-binding protein
MLQVSDLRAGYATGDVLQGVDVDVAPGEIVGVVGRNGVGKTTLMKAVIGLLQCRAGTIAFDGAEVTRAPAEDRARSGMAYVPQGRGIFTSLSVEENLRMGGFINAQNAAPDYERVYRYFPFLKERLNQRGGTLSGGQQAMLAIGRALINRPKLLLLDEPSDGVQPSIVHEIGDHVRSLNENEGLAVLIVEQNVDLMQLVAHRAYALDKGAVVAELPKAQIDDTETLSRYLDL